MRWHPHGDPGQASLGFLVRDDVGEHVAEATFASLAEILPAGVVLSDGAFIPYHRVRFVRRGQTLLWRARERSERGER